MSIIINTSRDSYGKDDIRTMTAQELIDILSECDPEDKVILSFDNGYTYGGITEDKMTIEDDDNTTEGE